MELSSIKHILYECFYPEQEVKLLINLKNGSSLRIKKVEYTNGRIAMVQLDSEESKIVTVEEIEHIRKE